MFDTKVKVIAGKYPGEREWSTKGGDIRPILCDFLGIDRPLTIGKKDGKFYRGNEVLAEEIYTRPSFPAWHVVELKGRGAFAPVIWEGPMPEYGVDAHNDATKLMRERVQMEREPHDYPIVVAVRRLYGGVDYQHYYHVIEPTS